MRVNVIALTDGLPRQVAEWWRDAVSDSPAPPAGTDMTAAPEWHAALARSFLSDGEARVLVAHTACGDVAALLPIYLRSRSRIGRIGDTVALLTELYGGRVALLAQPKAIDVLPALLTQLDVEYPRWSSLEMTLVDGNPSSVSLLAAARAHGYAIESEPLASSPYIALPDSFDAYFQTLKPNFRTEIRRGERRLREMGHLTCRLFIAREDVEPLWEAVCSIERVSWKEAAGTSITTNSQQERFYREILPRAAAAGQLLAPVLYLDDRPIAHKLCLFRDGTASILKMSYVEDLKRYYPSTVLLAGYLKDIIERGVRFLDFMGVCDDFKMRWTSLTYGRTRHLLFRNSLSGRFACARHRLARRLESVRARADKPGGVADDA